MHFFPGTLSNIVNDSLSQNHLNSSDSSLVQLLALKIDKKKIAQSVQFVFSAHISLRNQILTALEGHSHCVESQLPYKETFALPTKQSSSINMYVMLLIHHVQSSILNGVL